MICGLAGEYNVMDYANTVSLSIFSFINIIYNTDNILTLNGVHSLFQMVLVAKLI